eukprot:gene8346-9247_t
MEIYSPSIVAANEEIYATYDQSVQTPCSLSAYTPRKRKLKKLVVKKRKAIYALESRLKAKKSVFPISPQKVNNSKKVEKAFKLLEGLVSQELLSFMKKQVSLCQVKKKGRRYNDSFKALAISIYHINGKAYRFLSKLFSLPFRTKKTITSTVSRFASGIGFSEKSLYVLKQRIDVLPDAAKTCVLLMDEISLKIHLHIWSGGNLCSCFDDQRHRSEMEAAS